MSDKQTVWVDNPTPRVTMSSCLPWHSQTMVHPLWIQYEPMDGFRIFVRLAGRVCFAELLRLLEDTAQLSAGVADLPSLEQSVPNQ